MLLYGQVFLDRHFVVQHFVELYFVSGPTYLDNAPLSQLALSMEARFAAMYISNGFHII